MRGKSRAAVVVGLSATALVAASCGGSGNTSGGSSTASGGGQAGGSISVHGCNPKADLIPAATTETCAGDIMDITTARLVHFSPENAKAENDIAESIESKDGAKTFVIKIQKGRKFSDGTEIKADNFIKAWGAAAFAGNGFESGSFMQPIEGYAEVSTQGATVKELSGLKKIDDYTFEVHLTAPTSNFPVRLGYTAFAPMPDSFLTDPKSSSWGKKPVGAGPYEVVEWKNNEYVKLKKSANYNGKYGGKVDEITFKIYQDSAAAYTDVRAGKLDVTDEIPTKSLLGSAYKNEVPNRWAVRNDSALIFMVGFVSPKADPKVQNPKFKQAISMAIDRKLIIEKIFNNMRKPATSWVAAGVVGDYPTDGCGEYCEYNPDRAKQLLQEAGGYTGTLTISYNGDASHKDWVDAACTSIKNTLAIDCQGEAKVDFATFLKAVKADETKGLYRYAWQMDYPSPENFMAPIYRKGAGSNYNKYDNPAFEAKIKEADAAPSAEEGAKIYYEAEKMLRDNMPTAPLWGAAATSAWADTVSNVKITAFGKPDYPAITKK